MPSSLTTESFSARQRLSIRRASGVLRRGRLIVHTTATVPGVAAVPQAGAVHALCRFKQRQGPFLMLAASAKEALSWARFRNHTLRTMMQQNWPGPVTLVYPGRPGLPGACYQRGRIAVRVDADAHCRSLASQCGGLLLSSSFNRRGMPVAAPERLSRLRFHGAIQGVYAWGQGSGQASAIYALSPRGAKKLR